MGDAPRDPDTLKWRQYYFTASSPVVANLNGLVLRGLELLGHATGWSRGLTEVDERLE